MEFIHLDFSIISEARALLRVMNFVVPCVLKSKFFRP